MKEKIRLALTAVLLMGLIVFCWKMSEKLRTTIEEGRETSGKAAEKQPLVILDPGHGGKDPGKIGINGAKEKDINLQISLEIRDILSEEGIEADVTRTMDERLADSQVEDLRARVEMINEIGPCLTVSIHQNSYSDESVKGAQVFYFQNSEEGERAAGYIQNAFAKIDPENTKQIKANDTYYLLKNTEVPVVIAECGFLSNYEEAENLMTDEYRKKVAGAVAEGIFKYIEAVSR